MRPPDVKALRSLPSVDETLREKRAQEALAEFGRQSVVAAVRAILQDIREGHENAGDAGFIALLAQSRLRREAEMNLRPVFNLTGTDRKSVV